MKRNRILACGVAAFISVATMALPAAAGAAHLPKAPKAPKVKAGSTWSVEAEGGLVCVPVSFEKRHVVTVAEDGLQFAGTWAKSPTSVTVSYDGNSFAFTYERSTGYNGALPVIGIPVTLVSGRPCQPTTLPIP
jgi:hypothetical protein